jgi:hypothetical protein
MTQRTLIIGVAIVLAVCVLASAVVVNHVSCQRTVVTRSGLRIFFFAQAQRETGRARLATGTIRRLDVSARMADLAAAAAEGSGGCLGLFP